MHPSFLYEIAFFVGLFIAADVASPRVHVPGELFKIFLAAYWCSGSASSSFAATRSSPSASPAPSGSCSSTGPLIAWYFVRQVRTGAYRQHPWLVRHPGRPHHPKEGSMSDQMPDTPSEPPEKKGLSNGAIVAIVIVAIILLVFGVCVAVLSVQRQLAVATSAPAGMPLRTIDCTATSPRSARTATRRIRQRRSSPWRGCPATSSRRRAASGWSGRARGTVAWSPCTTRVPEILRYLEQWTAPDQGAHPRPAGQLRSRPRGLPRGACPRCRPSTRASCSRTSSRAATCAARRASPTPRPTRRASSRSPTVLANVDTRLSRENGRSTCVMLSGGEPTLHPAIARDPRRAGRRGRSSASC